MFNNVMRIGNCFVKVIAIALLVIAFARADQLAEAGSETLAVPDVGAWYPRTIKGDKGTLVIYAPQVES